MTKLIQLLRILSRQWQRIKASGATLDVDALMAAIRRDEEAGANDEETA